MRRRPARMNSDWVGLGHWKRFQTSVMRSPTGDVPEAVPYLRPGPRVRVPGPRVTHTRSRAPGSGYAARRDRARCLHRRRSDAVPGPPALRCSGVFMARAVGHRLGRAGSGPRRLPPLPAGRAKSRPPHGGGGMCWVTSPTTGGGTRRSWP